MIKRADNSTSCNEYRNDKEVEMFDKQSVSKDDSWEGLSEADKKMTFNEFIMHYNEEAFEITLPDGRKVVAVP